MSLAALVTGLAAMTINRLGGTTGDTYGAVNKHVEVAGYAALIRDMVITRPATTPARHRPVSASNANAAAPGRRRTRRR
jgi:hypothetical protein